MKFKSALLLIPLFSVAAQAGYVDYRHEYYDDGRNYDRVYMSHRFATGFGVAVEAISRSEDTQSNDAWNNMESMATSILQATSLLAGSYLAAGYCDRNGR